MNKTSIAKLLVLTGVVAVALPAPAIANAAPDAGSVTVEGSGTNVKTIAIPAVDLDGNTVKPDGSVQKN